MMVCVDFNVIDFLSLGVVDADVAATVPGKMARIAHGLIQCLIPERKKKDRGVKDESVAPFPRADLKTKLLPGFTPRSIHDGA